MKNIWTKHYSNTNTHLRPNKLDSKIYLPINSNYIIEQCILAADSAATGEEGMNL